MSRLDRIKDWEERAALAHYDACKLAKQCLISYSQLRRYLTASSGRAPQAWLDELRLAHAAQMILTGSLSIKEIASALHFSSQSQFCHQFKRQFGVTPSEFATHVRVTGAPHRLGSIKLPTVQSVRIRA